MGPNNRFRLFLHFVVTHRAFDLLIMGSIVANATALALDKPNIDPQSRLKVALNLADFVFVIIFAIEAGLKILVQGFVLHRYSYLRSKWNVLDFTVTLFGILTLAAKGGDADVSFFRAARSLRALRPLRVAMRFEGLKLVIDALVQAVPGIGNVILVTFLFYVMFGILGLNLFLGSLWYCEDQNGNQIDPRHYNLSSSGGAITKDWCLDNTDEDGGHHWLMCPPGADSLSERPPHFLCPMMMKR